MPESRQFIQIKYNSTLISKNSTSRTLHASFTAPRAKERLEEGFLRVTLLGETELKERRAADKKARSR